MPSVIDAGRVLTPLVQWDIQCRQLAFLGKVSMKDALIVEETIGGSLAIRRTFAFQRKEAKEIPVEIMVFRRNRQ
jgi:hypothetical protein